MNRPNLPTRLIIHLSAVSLLGLCLSSCDNSSSLSTQSPLACDSVSYQSDIRPIFDSKCSECHGSGSREGDFSSYDKLGPWFQEIRVHALVIKNMPPKEEPQLSSEELALMQCWFDSGHPEN